MSSRRAQQKERKRSKRLVAARDFKAAWTKPKAYTLPPSASRAVKAKADPACKLCNGSGVQGWEKGGYQARICKCVARYLECAEMRLSRVRARVLTECKLRAAGNCVLCKGEGALPADESRPGVLTLCKCVGGFKPLISP